MKNIQAQDCKVVVLSSKRSREFLSAEHFMGPDDRAVCSFGLYHGGDLASVLTIREYRELGFQWAVGRYGSVVYIVHALPKLMVEVKDLFRGEICFGVFSQLGGPRKPEGFEYFTTIGSVPLYLADGVPYLSEVPSKGSTVVDFGDIDLYRAKRPKLRSRRPLERRQSTEEIIASVDSQR